MLRWLQLFSKVRFIKRYKLMLHCHPMPVFQSQHYIFPIKISAFCKISVTFAPYLGDCF